MDCWRVLQVMYQKILDAQYFSYIHDPLAVVEALLQPAVSLLPSHIQSVYIQAVLKIFGAAVSNGVTMTKVRQPLYWRNSIQYIASPEEESQTVPTMRVDNAKK